MESVFEHLLLILLCRYYFILWEIALVDSFYDCESSSNCFKCVIYEILLKLR